MKKSKKVLVEEANASLEAMLAELKPFLPKRSTAEPTRPREWRLAPGSSGVRIERQNNKSNTAK